MRDCLHTIFAKERICSTKPSFFARRSWRRSPDCPAPLASAAFLMFGVQQQHAPGHVLCCMCGMGIPPNPAGMCVDCIRSQVRRPAAENLETRLAAENTRQSDAPDARDRGERRFFFLVGLRSRCERARLRVLLSRLVPPESTPRLPSFAATDDASSRHVSRKYTHVSQVDITEGVQKQCTVLYCKECQRYLQPPKHWIRADLESKELLTFCIKSASKV